MNTKALMQALRFACLPTISVLILLFFGFFSITKTIAFISSDNGWAIAIRVILVIAEMCLIWFMYEIYDKQIKAEEKKKANYSAVHTDLSELPKRKSERVSEYKEVRSILPGGHKYVIYDTESPDVKILSRVINKQN